MYIKKNHLQIQLCPSYNENTADPCDLALLQVDKPYQRSGQISWLPIGNGPPPEEPFTSHLCGWGWRTGGMDFGLKALCENRVKNFVLDVQVLPPAHCPPSRKG